MTSTSINAAPADATGTRPTIGGVAYDYNRLANQLNAVRRSDGRAIGFSYDALGRLSEQKLGNASIQYAYTNGHPTRINRTDSVTLDQTFDGPLWTSSAWTGAVKGNVKATYDKNLALSSLTVNDQSSVSFTYDADGLLTAATATVGAVTFARDAQSGNLTGVSVGNTTGTVTYGEFGEIASIATSVAGAGSTAGAPLFQQNIVERDALGRIKHLTETVQGISHDVSYEYDKAGRLAKQTRDGIATTFTFDANGNRTAVQEGTAAPIIATYDAQDRILTRGNSVFNHSDHGDLELRTGGATSLALSYDELGNLLRAVSSDGATQTTIEYKVDGLGRRVARMVGGKFDKAWLYRDSLRPVAEIAADGTFTHFVYPSNNPRSGAPVALIRGGTLYRVVKDHIGSVRLVVNAQTGAVAQSIDYDANGRVLRETGTGFQPFGFASGLYDATTGLVRFGARDYDPETGRWTNKDPIGFAGQQGNVYLYVGGDAVNGVDPTGEILRLAYRAARGLILSRRLGTGGAIRALKALGKQGGVWASSDHEAIQLAQKQSSMANGGGKHVIHPAGTTKEGVATRPHAHALDANGNQLPGHIWWGGSLASIAVGVLDADGDGELTAFDVLELANPFFWTSANATVDEMTGQGDAI